MTTELFAELERRDLIAGTSHEDEIRKALSGDHVTFYCGFDPTADSLHVGSLLPLTMMRRLQKHGHKPILLVGSGTGMIGDPSGKSEERVLLDDERLQHNVECLEKQASRFVSFDGEYAATVVRNDSWLRSLDLITFLRDVGKHFSVNAMMAKDSVRDRLENREQGISYTEFSYMLLQAYDFYYLYENHGCRMQIGGTDQWGNITAGTDFIRRKNGCDKGQAYGLVLPLITTSSGKKFGKTEQGTVWLDAKRTSPYRFFQYWLQTQDSDVIQYLLKFTELSIEEITDLEKRLAENPGAREAHTALAREMTTLVHGAEEMQRAENAGRVLFGASLDTIDIDTLMEIFADVPTTSISKEALASGMHISELLVASGATKSKGEARRLLEGGGVYLNNERVNDAQLVVTDAALIEETALVLRSGKKKYFLVRVA